MRSESNEDLPTGISRVLSFTQGNPVGPGYWDVVALLRRVADSIEAIPNIRVNDLVFHSVEASESEDQHITVYFHIAGEQEREVDRILGRHQD